MKGLFQERIEEMPPRTHNLIYLINKIGIKPEKDLGKFIVKFNAASITTRYPESLDEIQKNYTEEVVKEMVKTAEEVLKWIKDQF